MKKNMSRLYQLGMYLSMILCIASFTVYSIIGNKFLPDGTLLEPFFLVILAYFFILSFLVCLVLFLITIKKNKII